MNDNENKVRIKSVSKALAELNQQVVFVGGATISLYPDREVFETRPTDDVDVLIEILNYSNRVTLEEKLRTIGFTHDIESGIECRYKIHGITVDIMPTNDVSLGFNSIWYSEGFKKAVNYVIDESATVKILTPPYFIATKLEAFKDRGKNDGRTSQDFEDIIYVLENRSVVWKELSNSDIDIKKYLQMEFDNVLKNPNHFEWVDGHVERGDSRSTDEIIGAIQRFIVE